MSEHTKTDEKMFLRDINGYLYFSGYYHLRENHIPRIAIKSNPYSIHNIKLWLIINNKSFELISDTYDGAKINLKWRCLKCKDVFSMSWDSIHAGRGCAICSGRQVGISNCLATKNPELAKQWHPTLNAQLTPYNITYNSHKKVWWLCINNPKHEWLISPNTRSSGYTSCPYCDGKLPSEDYNLLVINPELCEEWDYEKNDKNPEEYCPNSGSKVWWKCRECNHEWKTMILNRNQGNGCPECNKSKGEKRVKIFLDKQNKYYMPQKEFNGLLGLGGKNLSYDFYLPDYNLLIEYQGEYHDGTANNQTKVAYKKQQEHDKRKKEYALNNNIKLLEIWYWDFERIEKMLTKELNLKY